MPLWLAACFESAAMLTPTNDVTQLPTETYMLMATSLSTPTTVPTSTPTVTTLPPASVTEGSSQTQDASAQGGIYFVTDEFDAVVYVLPNDWGEYLASPWQEEDKIIGSTITASSDLGAYLNWGASGVTISVSRQLDKGYIQMMDEFRDVYAESCEEHKSRWEIENDFHRGMRQRFWRCGGESGPTLDLLALVNKENPLAYTAMVIIVWFYPVEYQLNEEYLLSFIVIPDNLP
jgi:hypothetical protein